MRVTDLKALSDKVELDVALGQLSATQTFTKMRDLLNLALSHAAGQEAVAWTDARGLERLREGKQELVTGSPSRGDRVALYLAQPSTSAEVGRDAVVVIDLQDRGILHNAVITGPVKVIAKRIDQVDGNMFQPHGGWKGLSIGASSGRKEK